MKKYIALLIILNFTILSCEKDDICLETTTPNLIILFYDYDVQTDLKEVSSLTVWADGKENLYESQVLDSIVIPLNLAQDSTLYKFKSDLLEDEINFTYTKNDIFVSRSCGYKTIFENLEISNNSNNWIKDIRVINSTIDNETAAHIHIFH